MFPPRRRSQFSFKSRVRRHAIVSLRNDITRRPPRSPLRRQLRVGQSMRVKVSISRRDHFTNLIYHLRIEIAIFSESFSCSCRVKSHVAIPDRFLDRVHDQRIALPRVYELEPLSRWKKKEKFRVSARQVERDKGRVSLPHVYTRAKKNNVYRLSNRPLLRWRSRDGEEPDVLLFPLLTPPLPPAASPFHPVLP